MNKAGGSAAFGKWASKRIKTRVGAQLATVALGVMIFVDDYFNCLTVGNVMRSVTDRHQVSRAKLAYLIDATVSCTRFLFTMRSFDSQNTILPTATPLKIAFPFSHFKVDPPALPFFFPTILFPSHNPRNLHSLPPSPLLSGFPPNL